MHLGEWNYAFTKALTIEGLNCKYEWCLSGVNESPERMRKLPAEWSRKAMGQDGGWRRVKMGILREREKRLRRAEEGRETKQAPVDIARETVEKISN